MRRQTTAGPETAFGQTRGGSWCLASSSAISATGRTSGTGHDSTPACRVARARPSITARPLPPVSNMVELVTKPAMANENHAHLGVVR